MSQVKILEKGLKEKHILLGSLLCCPLAGGDLHNASSEILTVKKCMSLGNFKVQWIKLWILKEIRTE